MANPAVVVDFVANTKDLQKGFQEASGKASGFGQKIKGLAFGAATAGFAALAGTIKTGVDEFSDATKIGAQTAAVIKSTGNAANVTAGHVSDLAGALMKKSGVDDEAIQSGENLLLTFTNIRNEAGKGNDVFDQTTKAALDMSTALGTDMKSAAMQLGKALNDPVKGVSKLTRSGVTFTDAQKDQIKALQASGKTLEAQKIILAEVNKEFGGSAEAAGKTLPGQLNILRQQFNNFAGQLVADMIPALTAVTKLLVDHKTIVIAVVGVIATLTAGVLAVNAAMTAWNALQAVAGVAAKAWAAAQWLVNVALADNPIGLVVVAIAALVAGMVLAYKTSDTFRNAVDGAFKAILGGAQTVFGWLKANWPTLLAIITGPIGIATLAVIRNWDQIKGAVTNAVGAVKSIVTSGWNAVKTISSSAWGAVTGFVTDAVSDVKGALNGLVSWIKGFAAGVLTTEVRGIAKVWDLISDGAASAVSSVKEHINGLKDWLSAIADNVKTAANSVAKAIKDPINSVIDGWNRLEFTIPKVTIPKLKIGKKTFGGGGFGGKTIGFPNIPRLAQGGIVDQPTLALIGEAGPEAVVPLDRMAPPNVEVHVFIGDRELADLVRTEIVDANTGIARTLLAGSAG